MNLSSSNFLRWYNTETGEVISFGPFKSHTAMVLENPEAFGVDPTEFPENPGMYDGRVFALAMRNNWVRVYLDRRQPDFNSNLEAGSHRDAQKAMNYVFNEMDGRLIRFIVTIRTGLGDKEGDAYVMRSIEEMDHFIKRGRPHPDSQIVRYEPKEPEIEPEDEEDLEVIKRRAGVG